MPRDWMSIGWKILMARGAIALVFGIIAIAYPIATALTLAVVWGFWALADGISSLVQASQPGETRVRVGLAVMGVIALVAAFFAIFSPAVTAVTLTWILGIWLFLRGAFGIVLALTRSTPTPRWLLLLSAALDVLLGVLFAANPGRGAVGIAVVLGFTAIAWGIVFLGLGWTARKEALALGSAPGTPGSATTAPV